MKASYAFPVFTRGTGLGNRLFQWARARAWCYENKARMVSPIWIRLSIGHLLRRTVGIRSYPGRIALIGLFKKNSSDLSIYSLPWLLLRSQLSSEKSREPTRQAPDKRPILRLVNARNDSFEPLNRHQAQLKDDLLKIVAKRHRLRAEQIGAIPIGINIRLGSDFKPPPPPNSLSDGYHWIGWLQQTPVAWFVETLEAIRRQVGWDVPAIVVSDGNQAQLESLLILPKVFWLSRSNAIVDLLVLSNTKLLLGSGSSTFSAWASFLGQQPTVTAPGHPFTSLGLQPKCNQLIASFDPRNPDFATLAAMGNAVGRVPSRTKADAD